MDNPLFDLGALEPEASPRQSDDDVGREAFAEDLRWGDGKLVEGVIFGSSTGTSMRADSLGKSFKRTVGRANKKLAADNAERQRSKQVPVKLLAIDDTTFHDLRHFYTSLLINKGCNVKIVQQRLGHKSAKTTLDITATSGPATTSRLVTRSRRSLRLSCQVCPKRARRAFRWLPKKTT